jgi:hypothetical protein
VLNKSQTAFEVWISYVAEFAQRQWSESAKIRIHNATGCCRTIYWTDKVTLRKNWFWYLIVSYKSETVYYNRIWINLYYQFYAGACVQSTCCTFHFFPHINTTTLELKYGYQVFLDDKLLSPYWNTAANPIVLGDLKSLFLDSKDSYRWNALKPKHVGHTSLLRHLKYNIALPLII